MPKAFTHAGRQLEAREFQFSTKWLVRVYEGNRPVTLVKYTVTRRTWVQALFGQTGTLPVDLVQSLLDTAVKDVKTGTVRLLP